MGPKLETLTEAGANISPPRHRATLNRWCNKHPALGVKIGGRKFMFAEVRRAIASGVPLAEAERIGAACAERARSSEPAAA